jgi:hypothetical protein
MSSPRRGDTLSGLAALVLMAVGGLIATLCGLCTLLSAIATLSTPGWGWFAVLPFLIGLLPILVGVGMLAWGLRLWRAPGGKT